MSGQSKSSFASGVTLLLAGTQKHFTSGGEVLVVDGVSMTVDQATAEMKAVVQNRQNVVSAQAVASATLRTEDDSLPQQRVFLGAFASLVRLRFGSESEVLSDFGLPPKKKPAPRTAEQKAEAVAKAKATRAARHTMGPRQRAEVKGDVSAALVVTPMVNVPAASVPAATAGAAGAQPAAATAAVVTPRA